MIVATFLFWLSIGILVYAYGIFPGLMIYLGKNWKLDVQHFKELPEVVVVLAAYNEEAVIEEKVHRTFASTYPQDKLRLVIGTDCCSDRTDEILLRLQNQYPNLTVIPFTQRTGKPQIINRLIQEFARDGEILVLTDADTLFFPQTIERLIQPLADNSIGGVQGYIVSKQNELDHTRPDTKTVGATEVAFNHWDLAIKRGESRFGAVIGALGACYALRRQAYVPVPKGFINDDLFIFLQALNSGWKCVVAMEAKCEMEVSGFGRVQYRRKVRIAQGSFQLLRHYPQLLLPWKKVGFFLLSHKVLRWCTPIWLMVFFLSIILMWRESALPNEAFFIEFMAAPFLAWIAYRILSLKIFFPELRHFVHMNIALLEGMWRAFTKKSDGTWSNQ